jgi:hypothetical protein
MMAMITRQKTPSGPERRSSRVVAKQEVSRRCHEVTLLSMAPVNRKQECELLRAYLRRGANRRG